MKIKKYKVLIRKFDLRFDRLLIGYCVFATPKIEMPDPENINGARDRT